MKKILSLITIAIVASFVVTSFSFAEDLDKIKEAGEMKIAMSGRIRRSTSSTKKMRWSDLMRLSEKTSPSASASRAPL